MKDLSDLTLPKNRPYAEICDLLKENFTQTISVFWKRMIFSKKNV